MIQLNLYLNFNGNTEEAFQFYRSVLGGEFTELQRFRDTPAGNQVPPDDRHKIMHIALPVGQNMVLMGTDVLESLGQQLIQGNNCNLSLHPDSKAEAERLFNALSAGGKVEMPLQEMFWGAYFGAFTDAFGIPWMIHYAQKI